MHEKRALFFSTHSPEALAQAKYEYTKKKCAHMGAPQLSCRPYFYQKIVLVFLENDLIALMLNCLCGRGWSGFRSVHRPMSCLSIYSISHRETQSTEKTFHIISNLSYIRQLKPQKVHFTLENIGPNQHSSFHPLGERPKCYIAQCFQG